MAITIKQQPRRVDSSGYIAPNAAYTNLLYVLSSSNATQPQFRYVTTISEGGTDLTTIKTYPNETNNAVIDAAPILQSYLGYDKYWKLSGSADPVLSKKLFAFDFGEEYGTSISSSTTIYTGSAATSASIIPARVYKNSNTYDFQWERFAKVTASGTNNEHEYMTNNPAALSKDALPNGPYGVTLNNQDYQTSTIWYDGLTNAFTSSIGIQASYLENGVKSDRGTWWVTLRPAFPTYDVTCQTIGIGPQNLMDLVSPIGPYMGQTFRQVQEAEGINNYYTSGDVGGIEFLINDQWDGIINSSTTTGGSWRRNFNQQCPVDEYTRFAWINPYGFWDYYNVYNPLKKSIEIDRSFYHKPFVSYNETLSSYNLSNRGNTQYNANYKDIFTINTEYVRRPVSNWLSEMFESPEVYIQQTNNGNTFFTPINIMNNSSRWQLTGSREKLFQYTIQFNYSNERNSR